VWCGQGWAKNVHRIASTKLYHPFLLSRHSSTPPKLALRRRDKDVLDCRRNTFVLRITTRGILRLRYLELPLFGPIRAFLCSLKVLRLPAFRGTPARYYILVTKTILDFETQFELASSRYRPLLPPIR